MEYSFFQKNSDNDKLILFFNGFGMEDNFLRDIATKDDCNIIICYDYTNLDDLDEFYSLLSNYSEIDLIAWSLGVAVSSYIFTSNNTINFNKKVAINGTLEVLDNTLGIGETVFAGTIKNWDIDILRNKFFQRVANSNANLKMLNLPEKRNVESQKNELISLLKLLQNNEFKNIFNRVYIGNNDKIFPAQNQQNAWAKDDMKDIRVVENMGHYPFFNLELESILSE